MKKFICYSPFLQRPDKRVYEAQDNQKLCYPAGTSFPIVPVINGYAEAGEEIQVISVTAQHADGVYNFERLKEEVTNLCQEKGIICRDVTMVPVPYDEGVDAHIDTFQALIEHIDDGDELFGDVTYGSKIATAVILMTMRYAVLAKKNTNIGCVSYGTVDFSKNKEAKIYDESALVQLDDLVRILAKQGVTDMRAVLKQIIAI